MQEDFFSHERLSKNRAGLVERINELAACCRESNVDIIWIKQEFARDLSDAFLDVKRKNIHIVISGTPGAEILNELNFRPTDGLVVKKRYSGFFGTDLDERLASSGTKQLIVAGINTHACIRTTVVDAYQRDIDVILARDCIDSFDREHHDISWKYMDGNLGRGMSNEEIRLLLAGAA